MKPINLNKVRKNRAREAARAEADSNSVKFGTPKSMRLQAEREASRRARELDAKILEKPESTKKENPKEP